MSKAFTREGEGPEPEDDGELPDALPAHTRNCVTPAGLAALQAEYRQLWTIERPRIVEIVSWAAGNGDRSENGDYLFNKKKLREIDKRVRYLLKRLESAEVVDPRLQQGLQQVFFGAQVTCSYPDGRRLTVKLVGVDEADVSTGKISWLSPLAKALLKARVGDEVSLHHEGRRDILIIEAIAYPLG